MMEQKVSSPTRTVTVEQPGTIDTGQSDKNVNNKSTNSGQFSAHVCNTQLSALKGVKRPSGETTRKVSKKPQSHQDNCGLLSSLLLAASSSDSSTTQERDQVMAFKTRGLDCFCNVVGSALLSCPTVRSFLNTYGTTQGPIMQELARMVRLHEEGSGPQQLNNLRQILSASTLRTQNWTEEVMQCASEFLGDILTTIIDESTQAENIFSFSYMLHPICPGGRRGGDEGCPVPSGLRHGVEDLQTIVSVPIVSGGSLVDCIVNLMQIENQLPLGCTCTSNGRWTVQPEVLQHPEVLSVQLKRFCHTDEGHQIKDEGEIHVPQKMVLPFSNEVSYKFQSAAIHHGESPDNGHYTAIVRQANNFYHVNDDEVTEMASEDAMKYLRKAYLVFYEVDQCVSPQKQTKRLKKSAPEPNAGEMFLDDLVTGRMSLQFSTLEDNQVIELLQRFNISFDKDDDMKKLKKKVSLYVTEQIQERVGFDADNLKSLLRRLKLPAPPKEKNVKQQGLNQSSSASDTSKVRKGVSSVLEKISAKIGDLTDGLKSVDISLESVDEPTACDETGYTYFMLFSS